MIGDLYNKYSIMNDYESWNSIEKMIYGNTRNGWDYREVLIELATEKD